MTSVGTSAWLTADQSDPVPSAREIRSFESTVRSHAEMQRMHKEMAERFGNQPEQIIRAAHAHAVERIGPDRQHFESALTYARNKNFFAVRAKAAGLHGVYLQFDGVTETKNGHRGVGNYMRRNWMAYINPHGDESLSYTLSGAGSGGKKTLFNICYAVGLHRLAEELDLSLPLFLIIDSPMKNIGTEVNKDIFVAFYKHLYGLLSTTMTKTQVIIIDTELSAPTMPMDFRERLMIAGSTEHPPLIPYYSGH